MKKQCLRMHLNDKNLYELLRRKEKFSWYQENSIEKHIKDTIWELEELLEWVTNNDIDNIQEELQDVIMNVGQLIYKIIKEKDIKLDFKKHKQKILERSPNLKPWKYIGLEAEHKNWVEYKKNYENK